MYKWFLMLLLSFYFPAVSQEPNEPFMDQLTRAQIWCEVISQDVYELSTIRHKGISQSDLLETGKENFYIDSIGANSSIEYFGEQNSIEVDCEKLDFYKLKNIKLLKMDAEGHEPEVLQGSLKTLKNIQYISIDFGNERGVNKDHTFIEVNNILIRNNFNLIKYSQTRMSGLYKNKNFNE